MKPLPSHRKEFLLTGVLSIAIFLIYIFAPEAKDINKVFQGLIVSVVFFALLPLVYVRFVLKQSWQRLGLTLGNYREQGLAALFILLIALAGFLVGVTFFKNFQTFYTMPVRVEQNFWWFLGYEMVLVPLVVGLYEVFFRGFLMLLWLSEKAKWWSIIIQTVLFFGLVSLTGSLSWDTAPLIYISLFSGLIAYRSRSILYSFVASWLFLLIVDVYFLVIR